MIHTKVWVFARITKLMRELRFFRRLVQHSARTRATVCKRAVVLPLMMVDSFILHAQSWEHDSQVTVCPG